jgi:hypothetical protein
MKLESCKKPKGYQRAKVGPFQYIETNNKAMEMNILLQ